MGPADVVAPSLLGSRLVSVVDGHRVVVRITEVEAYGGVGEDAASHAHRGPTPRNAAMFGPPGHAYVYLSYGMHWCMNVVTGPPGVGSAVLLRAGEVVGGLDTARARRATARADRDLARGPALLTAALGVDGRFDGVDLLRDGDIRLQRAGSGNDVGVPCRGPRIGIRREVDRPWRWWVAGNPTVSGTVRREG